MGTYKKVRIDANTNDENTIVDIYNAMKKFEMHYCWRKYCEETKWWPHDSVLELSKQFPSVMFRIDLASHGFGGPDCFVLNGQYVDAGYVMQKFISLNKFKQGLSIAAKAKRERDKARLEEARKQKLKELEQLESRAELLRQEVANG